MADDWELLDRFAARRDQAAFAELVHRHIDLVHGAAHRMLGGPGAEAEDVTQAVFLLLAQKARQVPRRGLLAGWLFQATRYCSLNQRKAAGRRRAREREAAMMRPEVAETSENLNPLLDDALASLGAKERQAILACYLQRQTAAQAGDALRISSEAVEKRLERGLGRMRSFFSRRGMAISTAALLTLLATERAHAAPHGLHLTIQPFAAAHTPAAGIAQGAAAAMARAQVLAATWVAAVVAAVFLTVGFFAVQMGAGGQAETPSVMAVEKPETPAPAGDLMVDAASSGSTLHMALGRTLDIHLDGNITTGYQWMLTSLEGTALEPSGQILYEAQPAGQRVGSGGVFSGRFRAAQVGQAQIHLGYRRPWEAETAPVRTFELKVIVDPAGPGN